MKKEKEKENLSSLLPLLFSACRAQTLRPLLLFLGRGPAGQLPHPLPLSLADRWGPSVSSFSSNRLLPLPSLSVQNCRPPLPTILLPPPRLALLAALEPEPPSRSYFALSSAPTLAQSAVNCCITRRSAAVIHRPPSGQTEPYPPPIFTVVSAPPSPLPLRLSPVRFGAF